jgi:hypothetical protein
MNLTDEELQNLKDTKSEQEWNNTCDEVKRARGGQYPPDWYAKVLATGLAHEVQANW